MKSSVEDELIVQAIYLVVQMTLNANHAKYIEIKQENGCFILSVMGFRKNETLFRGAESLVFYYQIKRFI